MMFLNLILPVLLSYLLTFFFKPKNKRLIKLLLSFSGAFLLATTLFVLFPEVYGNLSTELVGTLVAAGVLIQIFLEFFSNGAEHGHDNESHSKKTFPWVLFISISIHAFLEGFPLGADREILLGVLIHKIPVTVILTLFLIDSGLSKWKIAAFILLFSLMTPLGSYFVSTIEFFHDYHHYFTALVIGVFLHISTVILFESSEDHSFNLNKLLIVVCGIVTAYLV